MLKITLIVIAICNIVLCIPTFPSGFSANFVRTTYEYSPSNSFITSHHIEFNLEEKRTYVEVNTIKGNDWDDGVYWLIYRPEGADKDSFASSGYTLFSLKNETSTHNTKELSCSYTTSIILGGFPSQPPNIFPPHWQLDGGSIEISSWFAFDDKMDYGGTKKSKDKDVDTWYSTKNCQLFGELSQPCYILYTLFDKAVPFFHQLSYEKRPATFEEDWMEEEEWNFFEESQPTIQPPQDWTTTCYNIQNGFSINPIHGFVSTADGSDNFTISLTAAPIHLLGNVTVTFITIETSCKDCIEFQTIDGRPLSSLTFTSNNWNQMQTVLIKYLKDGETYFNPIAVGGGYEIRNWQTGFGENKTTGPALRVLTCRDGVPGYGCNKR